MARSSGSKDAGAYAPFRPRWGRRVPNVVAVVVVVAFGVAAATLQADNWTPLDRLFLFALGVATAWFVHRFARIEARASEQGLRVRNLFLSRTVTWPQVLRLQFGGGAPWASLELTDTDQVAIMAIQKADGEHGRALAARLAALIEHHASSPEPPRPSPPRPEGESGREGDELS